MIPSFAFRSSPYSMFLCTNKSITRGESSVADGEEETDVPRHGIEIIHPMPMVCPTIRYDFTATTWLVVWVG